MKNKQKKADLYFADIDKWEEGDLGDTEEFDKPSTMPTELKNLLNGYAKSNRSSSQTMQLISMRLPTTLIEDLKIIGEVENLGYQTLAREVLTRFVETENRKKLNKLLTDYKRLKRELDDLKAEKDKEEKQDIKEKLASS